jgi:putative DNA primase/helicase
VSASEIDVTQLGSSPVQVQPSGEAVESQPSEPPQPTIDRCAEIARLKTLSKLDYELERKPAAKKLGISRVSALDELVGDKRGGKGGASNAQGRPLALSNPEAWTQPVLGAALLDDLVAAIRRHVFLRPPQADAVALWIVAAHAFDAWHIFPRLFISAPDRRCGKTTLIELLSCLVSKPLSGESVTASTVFRVIEATRPTLLLDEADHYRRDNEELRAVIDSGHSRQGNVIRNVPVGDGWEPRAFSTWAPMVLAAIGRLWATVEDRSIEIAMRRKRPDEHVEALRLDRVGHLDTLPRKVARWVRDHMTPLSHADPEMPRGIYNRAADNWRPLLAIADAVGGDWPKRAREAAAALSADADDSESNGVLLLGDLRRLFDAEPIGLLFTKEILARLNDDETRPWGEWKAGKPFTDHQLASLLKPYKIAPKTVRRGAETGKGYRLEWFDDAFRRYLPPRSVTPL